MLATISPSSDEMKMLQGIIHDVNFDAVVFVVDAEQNMMFGGGVVWGGFFDVSL
jgi:hypothetical protein